MFGPHAILRVQKAMNLNSCCYCPLQIKHCPSHTPALPCGIVLLVVDVQLCCEVLGRTKRIHTRNKNSQTAEFFSLSFIPPGGGQANSLSKRQNKALALSRF